MENESGTEQQIIITDETRNEVGDAVQNAFARFKEKQSTFNPKEETADLQKTDEEKKMDIAFRSIVLLKIANFAFTGFNLMAYNWFIAKNKKISFEDLSLDTDELEGANEFIEPYAEKIMAMLPDWVWGVMYIESLYIDKMMDLKKLDK